MRVFLSVLVLIFSFQSWTKADDIRDYKIEEIGIGDSLLSLVNKSEIEKKKEFKHSNKKYFDYLYLKKNSKFDHFTFGILDGDKNYIIEDISAGTYFPNNIKACLKQMDEVIEDISNSFPNLKKTKKKERKHRGDSSQKTIITEIYFNFSSGDVIAIQCIDFSKTLNYNDQLNIEMASSKYFNWMHSEAFK